MLHLKRTECGRGLITVADFFSDVKEFPVYLCFRKRGRILKAVKKVMEKQREIYQKTKKGKKLHSVYLRRRFRTKHRGHYNEVQGHDKINN